MKVKELIKRLLDLPISNDAEVRFGDSRIEISDGNPDLVYIIE